MLYMPGMEYDNDCTHSVFVRGLCGDCGMPMDSPQASSVSMVHSVPGLKVSVEYAREIGEAEQQRLIAENKLVLLVDLDQTLLHTTFGNPGASNPDIYSFNLTPDQPTFHTKLRPFLREFLDEMVKIYELHIFTFGSRNYAHKIATIIDPEKRYFGDRILSRDESVDQYSKHGNLNNLFPCGDAMVCIIDDRADVWKDAANLIQVKPYSYFKTSISDGAKTPAAEATSEEEDQDEKDLEDLLSDFIDSPDDDDEGQEGQQDDGQVLAPTDASTIATEETRGSDTEERSATNTTTIPTATKTTTTTSSDSQALEAAIPDCDDKSTEQPEKEQEKVVVDNDVYLKELIAILTRIHAKWYEELEREREFLAEGERYKLPAIADIIRKYFRKRYK